MWTKKDRDTHSGGFKNVVSAHLHQAAANEGNIRGGVKLLQFSHGVADYNVHIPCQFPGVLSAADNLVSRAPAEPGDACESFRMPWNHNQQEIRKARLELAECCEDIPLFARVRARSNQDETLAPPLSAQPPALGQHRCLHRRIELEIAGDLDEVSGNAEVFKLLRILAGLGAQQMRVRQHGVGGHRDALVAPQRVR